jgi:hypothetical protein
MVQGREKKMDRATVIARSLELREQLEDRSPKVRSDAALRAASYGFALRSNDAGTQEEKKLLLDALKARCDDDDEMPDVRKHACDSLRALDQLTEKAWAKKIASIEATAQPGRTTHDADTKLEKPLPPKKTIAKRITKEDSRIALFQEEELLRKDIPDESLVIHLDEVTEARAEVIELHAPIVARFQRLLDSLVGRRGATPDDNKTIAKAVFDAAECSGIDLCSKGQPVNFRWHQVFEGRTPDAARRTIVQSADFPTLIARAKVPAEKSKQK